MSLLIEIFKDFFSLFLPSKCLICGLGLQNFEKHVCKSCLVKIPKTGFQNFDENPVSQAFWGRVNLEKAFAFYYFHKGSVLQDLIHEIKYNGLKELAYELGKEIGFGIKKSTTAHSFDMIVPVPLHPLKEKKRGYNQSEWIAKGIGEVLNISVDKKSLVRKIYTATQTKKNRIQRWENVKDAFFISNSKYLENRHIALVDDVITTGATLEACAAKILEIKGSRVSVVALAFASD
ncbi:MAG: ComF family protein [Bacteroidales bacterium]